MTKLEALKDLAAKVEAGEFDLNQKEALAPKFYGFMSVAESALGLYEPIVLAELSWRTYNGSLDAAKALHDAVLPEFAWFINFSNKDEEPEARIKGYFMETCVSNSNLARAWLLAILRALIAEEELA